MVRFGVVQRNGKVGAPVLCAGAAECKVHGLEQFAALVAVFQFFLVDIKLRYPEPQPVDQGTRTVLFRIVGGLGRPALRSTCPLESCSRRQLQDADTATPSSKLNSPEMASGSAMALLKSAVINRATSS